MAGVHEWFAWVVVILNGAAGAWITLAHWLEAVRSRVMWMLVHTAHVAVAIQVTLGSLIVAVDGVEVSQFHAFYGFLTFIAVGLIVAYRQLTEFRYLIYGLGSLFIMGLAIRALTLSPLA